VVVDLRGALDSRRLMFSAEQPGALRITGPGVAAMDGVESMAVPVKSGRCAPADIVALLVERGCRRILVEGGGALVSAFVAARALDRLHLAVAPLITGEGIRGLGLPPVHDLSEAIRPLSRQIEMGRDTLFDLELRDGQ
jgi:riboflavin biosynthesis pyrimidine reductase